MGEYGESGGGGDSGSGGDSGATGGDGDFGAMSDSGSLGDSGATGGGDDSGSSGDSDATGGDGGDGTFGAISGDVNDASDVGDGGWDSVALVMVDVGKMLDALATDAIREHGFLCIAAAPAGDSGNGGNGSGCDSKGGDSGNGGNGSGCDSKGGDSGNGGRIIYSYNIADEDILRLAGGAASGDGAVGDGAAWGGADWDSAGQIEWGGRKASVILARGERLGLTVVAGLPVSLFGDSVAGIAGLLLAYLSVALLLGILLALLLARRQARPVEGAIRAIGELGIAQGAGAPAKKPGLAFIRDSIAQIGSAMGQSEALLSDMRGALGRSLAEKILRGGPCGEGEIGEFKRCCGFAGDSFAVACAECGPGEPELDGGELDRLAKKHLPYPFALCRVSERRWALAVNLDSGAGGGAGSADSATTGADGNFSAAGSLPPAGGAVAAAAVDTGADGSFGGAGDLGSGDGWGAAGGLGAEIGAGGGAGIGDGWGVDGGARAKIGAGGLGRLCGGLRLLRLALLVSAGADVRFGVSRPCAGAGSLRACLRQARDALELGLGAGMGVGVCVYEAPRGGPPACVFTPDMSRRLCELVRMSEAGGINGMFDEMRERLSGAGDIVGQEKSQIVLSVRNALCHAASLPGVGTGAERGADGSRARAGATGATVAENVAAAAGETGETGKIGEASKACEMGKTGETGEAAGKAGKAGEMDEAGKAGPFVSPPPPVSPVSPASPAFPAATASPASPSALLPLVADYSESDSIGKCMDDMRSSALLLAGAISGMQKKRAAEAHGAIIRHIQQNYADPGLCAASVGQRFGLSEKYAFGIVKSQTGQSFGEYLERLRLDSAASLMESTDAAINAICRQVGFNAENTFYKAFKRVYGVSPGAWRKRLAADRLKISV